MRMPGEQDERGAGLPLIYMMIGVSLFILIILAVVMANNGNKRNNSVTHRNNAAVPTLEPETTPGNDLLENAYVDQLYNENKLRVDDLDFWDMYPKEDDPLPTQEVAPEAVSKTPEATPKEIDPSEDGKHTLINRRDGTSEWVKINPYITKNTYDPMKLIRKQERLGYYEGQKPVSFFGVDISKYNGTVDFEKLKNDGVDFVMIRLGARGYGNGQILPDENFETNITGANEAGIDVGVYFFSQAITVEEAAEEAAFVVNHLTDRKVVYPVVFDMEYINNDTARIDLLKKNEKTEIAKAFLTDVKAAGYIPMIYGTKEWLIEQIDLTKLLEYDIWLSQQTELPDYPYQYQMWQYSLSGSVAGISGNVDFNISFIDYGAKY